MLNIKTPPQSSSLHFNSSFLDNFQKCICSKGNPSSGGNIWFLKNVKLQILHFYCNKNAYNNFGNKFSLKASIFIFLDYTWAYMNVF